MSNELTYILGAGASYQSIPIVKTFPERFKCFLNHLKAIWQDFGFPEDKRVFFEKVHNTANSLLNSFESHQSFDTYFKKLFHTNQKSEIIESKKILNLYFVWEHLAKDISIPPQSYDGNIFLKQANIDKRYDALIAGLLQPIEGDAKTYCKVNFISWNYDLNLFCSLKNYFKPAINIEEFKSDITVRENHWNIDNQINVINMNGFFYSTFFDKIKNLPENEYLFHDIFNKEYLKNKYQIDSEKIKFAWENKLIGQTNSVISAALDVIKNSKTIVIIGYTFPLYNRLVDFEYFNGNLLNGKKVIIQDPNAEEIKKEIMENFSIGEGYMTAAELVVKTNCDSFYIPNTIYRYKN